MKLLQRIDEPKSKWLIGSPKTFDLPTEVVVSSPQLVSPLQGRYYEIDLYVRGDQLLPYSELRQLPDFNGTAYETQVFLYEVWTDCGDDGHVDYKLICWALLSEKVENPLRIFDDIS